MTDSIYDDGSLEPNLDMPEHIAKWTGDAWDALRVDVNGTVFVGGAFITAAKPAPVKFTNLRKRACPYCGNTSGLKDSRGMCISCGGDLGSDSGNKREFPKPIIDWKI